MLQAVISAALSIGLVAGGNVPAVQDWMGEVLANNTAVFETCTEPMGNAALDLTESHEKVNEAAATYDALNLRCTALGVELADAVQRIRDGFEALLDTSNMSPELAAEVEQYRHVLTPEVVAQIREMSLDEALAYVYTLVEIAEKSGEA
jgi:hypothetical protein